MSSILRATEFDENIHKTSSNIIIPWSGGVDSTAILFELIKLHDRNIQAFESKNIVLFCAKDTNGPQGAFEKAARKRILTYIKLKHPEFHSRICVMDIDKEYVGIAYPDSLDDCLGHIHQPYWWLTTILGHIHGSYTILFGYIAGDDFWMFFDKFAKVWEASLDFFYSYPDRYMAFPLSRLDKNQVWHLLPDEAKKLVFWCEYPVDYSPCGECGSCVKHYKYVLDGPEPKRRETDLMPTEGIKCD